MTFFLFSDGKQVHVYDFTAKNKLPDQKDGADALTNKNPRWIQQEEMLKNQEAICDSGKLFFRNLAYTVTEEDVQKLFEKYGNVVEVNIPVDSVSRKIKVTLGNFCLIYDLISNVYCRVLALLHF